MLEVTKNKEERYKTAKPIKKTDLIIEKVSYDETYDKDGNKIIKRKIKQVNLTKKLKEQSKLVKEQIASTKLDEINKILGN